MKDTVDKLEIERELYISGKRLIAGVDEVGRGPLAGPVVCAAVIMPLCSEKIIAGVDDSKKLSEKKRETLSEKIKQTAVSYCIAEVSPEEIDRINILNAVKKCMEKAVAGLSPAPDITIVDGLNTHLNFPAKYVVKGDMKSYTVGCASIIAKVYRDDLMKKQAENFPAYGFEKHKGYGTKDHIAAIKENGPCRIHRKTFIKNFWDGAGK